VTADEHAARWRARFIAEHGRKPGELTPGHLASLRSKYWALGAPSARREGKGLTPEQVERLRADNPLVQRARLSKEVFGGSHEISWGLKDAALKSLTEDPADELARLEREILDGLNGDDAP
jgi:hypothetical protein